VTCLQPELNAVCINASWCIGQSLTKYGKLLQPYVQQILNALVQILKTTNITIGDIDQNNNEDTEEYNKIDLAYIVSNASITLARLVKVFPDEILKLWNSFAIEWICGLEKFNEDNDKIDAFLVLMKCVSRKPQTIVSYQNGVEVLFSAIAHWKNPPLSLIPSFKQIIQLFKQNATNWNYVLSLLAKDVYDIIVNKYDG